MAIDAIISIAMPSGYASRGVDLRLQPFLNENFDPASAVISTGITESNGQYVWKGELPSTTQFVQFYLLVHGTSTHDLDFPVATIEDVLLNDRITSIYENGTVTVSQTLVYQPTIAITPSDTNDVTIAAAQQEGFFAIDAGNIRYRDTLGNLVTVAVAEYQVIETNVTRIYATSTTAARIFMIYDLV